MMQECELCDPADTAITAQRNINICMETGIASRIEATIRESGVRDHTTDFIVQPLLDLRKRLRTIWVANNPLSLNDVREKLDTEYRQLSCNQEFEELINPLLLRMPGRI